MYVLLKMCRRWNKNKKKIDWLTLDGKLCLRDDKNAAFV